MRGPHFQDQCVAPVSTVHNACVFSSFVSKRWRFDTDFTYSLTFCYSLLLHHSALEVAHAPPVVAPDLEESPRRAHPVAILYLVAVISFETDWVFLHA